MVAVESPGDGLVLLSSMEELRRIKTHVYRRPDIRPVKKT